MEDEFILDDIHVRNVARNTAINQKYAMINDVLAYMNEIPHTEFERIAEAGRILKILRNTKTLTNIEVDLEKWQEEMN